MGSRFLLPFLLIIVTTSASGYSCRECHLENNIESHSAAEDRAETADFESWGYVQVQANASMFWWLYHSTAKGKYTERPLVLWLQGGPGQASSGVGNFLEIGPLDLYLKNRTLTWTKEVNVLFVDSPVGTGYSYVTNSSAYASSDLQVAHHLLVFLKKFLYKVPEFQRVPLTIFGESYGAKTAVLLADILVKEIKEKKVTCSFKGVALGDGWISPATSVDTWGPYLYSTSLVDLNGLTAINKITRNISSLLKEKKLKEATDRFVAARKAVSTFTNNVNFYNIFKKSHIPAFTAGAKNIDILSDLVLKVTSADPLTRLMNSTIREKLKIIPKNVTWGAQSKQVLQHLYNDFMLPATEQLDGLLNNSISVAVYNGQLDLLSDTIGTCTWVDMIKWPGTSAWRKSKREVISISKGETNAFVKSYKMLSFFWVLKAGVMVPTDAPDTALHILKHILKLE